MPFFSFLFINFLYNRLWSTELYAPLKSLSNAVRFTFLPATSALPVAIKSIISLSPSCNILNLGTKFWNSLGIASPVLIINSVPSGLTKYFSYLPPASPCNLACKDSKYALTPSVDSVILAFWTYDVSSASSTKSSSNGFKSPL